MIRRVGNEDGKTKGNDSSQSVAPTGKMQQLAEPSKPCLPPPEDQPIDEFMEEIQTVRDASKVDDRPWQVFGRKAEHTEEEQQGSCQDERPAYRGLQDG